MISHDGGRSQAPVFRLLFLPEGFDDALRVAPAWIWKYRREISVLMSRLITAARAKDYEEWIPIRWLEGVAVFGRSPWRKATDWLAAEGWIDCDDSYAVGEKAMGYRRGPQWRGVPVRTRAVYDREVLRMVDAIRGRSSDEPMSPTTVEQHLARWLLAFTLDPGDIERELAMIDGLNPRRRRRMPTTKVVTARRGRNRTPEEVEAARREYARILIAMAIEGGPAERGWDRCKYRRFHSIVTNMPRWMRRAIRIDGRALVEIDIVACQPLIQAIAAATWTATRDDETTTTGATGTTTRDHGTPPPLSTVFGCNLPPDLAGWLGRYAGGEDAYAMFAKAIGMPCGDAAERAGAKDAWMKLAYDRHRPSDPRWCRLWDAYRKACPTVASWLEAIKRGPGPKPYAEAARACQRLESRVMIDGVIGHLVEHHPGMAVLTVHDSLLVHPEDVATVRGVIRTVWLREAGFEPRTKVKEAA